MKLHLLPPAMAAFLGLSAMVSHGELLLSDDFTVTSYSGQPNSLATAEAAANNNIVNRQSGSQAVSEYTLSRAGFNVQTGNTNTILYPGGTPVTDNGNYLLIANTGVRNNLAINAALTGGQALSFSFDLYLGSNSSANTWGAFSLSTSAGDGYPTGATTLFCFLAKANNTIQAFNGNNIVTDPPTPNTPYLEGPFTGEYSSPSWTVVFSDVVDGDAGTGSPFGGNGTFAAIYYNGELIDGRALDTEFGDNTLYFGFSARDAGSTIGIDNLSVNTVPEPASVGYFVVAAGMGLAVLVIRRRRVARD